MKSRTIAIKRVVIFIIVPLAIAGIFHASRSILSTVWLGEVQLCFIAHARSMSCIIDQGKSVDVTIGPENKMDVIWRDGIFLNGRKTALANVHLQGFRTLYENMGFSLWAHEKSPGNRIWILRKGGGWIQVVPPVGDSDIVSIALIDDAYYAATSTQLYKEHLGEWRQYAKLVGGHLTDAARDGAFDCVRKEICLSRGASVNVYSFDGTCKSSLQTEDSIRRLYFDSASHRFWGISSWKINVIERDTVRTIRCDTANGFELIDGALLLQSGQWMIICDDGSTLNSRLISGAITYESLN